MSDECETCGGTGIAPVLYNAREPCKDCSDHTESDQSDSAPSRTETQEES